MREGEKERRERCRKGGREGGRVAEGEMGGREEGRKEKEPAFQTTKSSHLFLAV